MSTRDLLSAEALLRELGEQMAREFQDNGKTWPRPWAQRHFEDRNAILRVRNLIIERAERNRNEARRSS